MLTAASVLFVVRLFLRRLTKLRKRRGTPTTRT
jgi:hypothetical protein